MRKVDIITVFLFYIITQTICQQLEANKIIGSVQLQLQDVTFTPFCIIRYQNKIGKQNKWDDIYLSYDKVQQSLIIQHNQEMNQVFMGFTQQERFVLCYQSAVVENQITLVSLQKNYEIINENKVFRIQEFSQTDYDYLTEYQYNIASRTLKNVGPPIRKTNDTSITVAYSLSINIIKDGVQISSKLFQSTPIPNYDNIINVSKDKKGNYILDEIHFMYDKKAEMVIVQQYGATNEVGYATFKPIFNDIYTTINAPLVNITYNTQRIAINPRQLFIDNSPPIFKNNKYYFTPNRYDLYQQINSDYLMITANQNHNSIKKWFIIKQNNLKGILNQNQTSLDFSKIEQLEKNTFSNSDFYFFDLAQFPINPLDWLGVIEIQVNENITLNFLTSAQYDSDYSHLNEYSFYLLNLTEKKIQKLNQNNSFSQLEGFTYRECFNSYQGLPIKLKYDELNGYTAVYLVKDKQIAKFQFNLSYFLKQNKINDRHIYVFEIILIIGCFIQVILYQCYSRSKKIQIQKLQKINFIGIYQNENDYADIKQIKTFLKTATISYNNFSNDISQCKFKNDKQKSYLIPAVMIQKCFQSLESQSCTYIVYIQQQNVGQLRNILQDLRSFRQQGVINKDGNGKPKFYEINYIFEEIQFVGEIQTEYKKNVHSQFAFVTNKTKQNFYQQVKDSQLETALNPIQNKESLLEYRCIEKRAALDVMQDNPSYNHKITQQVYLELVLLRKFTKALYFLYQREVILPDLKDIYGDLIIYKDEEITINPLLIFYVCQIKQSQKFSKEQLDQVYLTETEKYIEFLQITCNKSEIPTRNFDNFGDCERFYDFHISISEFQKRFNCNSKLLGIGGFGTVYDLYDRKNDNHCALKIQNLVEKDDVCQGLKEFNILKRLTYHNQNNVQLKYGLMAGQIFNKHIKVYYTSCFLIMEKGQSLLADLKDRIQKNNNYFPSHELEKIIYSMCTGLKKLHKKEKLVHGDLSLDNILIVKNKQSQKDYKFTDFGSAVEVDQINNMEDGLTGKPLYISPSMLNLIQQNNNNKQLFYQEIKRNPEILYNNDRFSLGMIFYQLIILKKLDCQQIPTYQEKQQQVNQWKHNLNRYIETIPRQYNNQLLQYYPQKLIRIVQNLLEEKEFD